MISSRMITPCFLQRCVSFTLRSRLPAPAYGVTSSAFSACTQTFAKKKSAVAMDKFITRTKKDGTVIPPPVENLMLKTPTKSKTKKRISSPDENDTAAGKKSPSKTAAVSPGKEASPSKTSVDEDAVVPVSTSEYDPTKENYHPVKDACWRVGEKTPYVALAKTLEAIASESSSTGTVQIMANFLRSLMTLSKQDTLRCVYLCLNRIAPPWESVELGIGESILMKALAEATGQTLPAVKKLMQEKGDLGEVAAQSRLTQTTLVKPKALTVESVFNTFKEISAHSGHEAQKHKGSKIKNLLVACVNPSEARFILRSLRGKMRIGLAEQNMLAAISLAALQTPPNQSYPPAVIDALRTTKGSSDAIKTARQQVKSAYNLMPNYDKLLEYLLEGGLEAVVQNCNIMPGVPVKPMLAKPTKGVQDVLASLGDSEDFACEWKYDGERAQLHRTTNGKYHIYSRNLENHTDKYPDIIKVAPGIADANVTSYILDSEVVAWDVKAGVILPFQVLTTRKRKREKSDEEVKVDVQVCIFAFDLLYLNGDSLIERPLSERRKLLREHFKPTAGRFVFATEVVTHDADVVQSFMNEAVEGRCEGLMVKQLDATYQVAYRSNKWLKLKKDYIEGLGDSVDCVVMGAFYGTGKRTGVYGAYLLGVFDPSNEEYQTICRLGTGFSDEQLTKFTAQLKKHAIDKPKSYYRIGAVTPDVWFEPSVVWEIKAADLSMSPVHTAAIGLANEAKGISLRFPRFIRLRDDKPPEECTPAELIYEMYKKQSENYTKDRKDKKKGADSGSDGEY